jgi:hypothetical protein
MLLSSGVRVIMYNTNPLLKGMGDLTDNMENKLTKHNTENSNNVQHDPHHGFKQWGSCCTLFEFSVLCLVNLFSMLSVSSSMVLSSGVRVVHYLKTMGELTLTTWRTS